jgi:hypothetical protein
MAAAVGALPGAAQTRITVGPPAQISRPERDTAIIETFAAADPVDASRLIVCIMSADQDGRRGTAAYWSGDSGRTWTRAADFDVKGMDPACAIDRYHRTYVTTMAAVSPAKAELRVARSPTWPPRFIVGVIDSLSGGMFGRPYAIADVGSGKYPGRIYVYGQTNRPATEGADANLQGLALWYSRDGGATFSPAVERFPDDASRVYGPGNTVIMADGTFAGIVTEAVQPAGRGAGSVKLITSSDGGRTLNPAVIVSNRDIPGMGGPRDIPSLAVDASPSAFHDRLYVVWPDKRFFGRTRMLISYSIGQGQSWSYPKPVDRAEPRPAGRGDAGVATMPVVAVSGDGVVGVQWHEVRDSASYASGYEVRFAASFDGGETFTPSVVVARVDGQADAWTAAGSVEQTRGEVRLSVGSADLHPGDAGGMTVDAAGVFHPMWVDFSTGAPQLWTAAVTVPGSAVRNGSISLANAIDVSDQVTLDVINTRHYVQTGDLYVTVRLTNHADSAFSGPIRFRVTSILSAIGVPSMVDAEMPDGSGGGVWDLTPALINNVLPARGTSAERTFKVHLTHVVAPVGWGQRALELYGRVLAGGG